MFGTSIVSLLMLVVGTCLFMVAALVVCIAISIFSDTIKNYSTNKYRRVELTAQLAHGADVAKATEILKAAMAAIPNVEKKPAPDVEIVTFTLAGPVLAVRPYCHTDHYWQVYFATTAAIRSELGKAGFKVAEQHLHVASAPAAA